MLHATHTVSTCSTDIRVFVDSHEHHMTFCYQTHLNASYGHNLRKTVLNVKTYLQNCDVRCTRSRRIDCFLFDSKILRNDITIMHFIMVLLTKLPPKRFGRSDMELYYTYTVTRDVRTVSQKNAPCFRFTPPHSECVRVNTIDIVKCWTVNDGPTPQYCTVRRVVLNNRFGSLSLEEKPNVYDTVKAIIYLSIL